MAQQIADRRDVDFVLHEQLEVEKLSVHDKFAEFNKKVIDLIVGEARNLAVKEIMPTQVVGDTQGVKLENGTITTPDEFKRAY
ncbi:MAG: acyl-CoA dehydrogenase family protein, partial [Desulfobacterales bacterium]|nr:acyl-CoA dehydrogenase family protein [Desulfobacterales bacterium]